MRDFLTKVIQVRYSADPPPDRPWLGGRICLAVLVLCPQEVKRPLATVDNAKARAVQLAR